MMSKMTRLWPRSEERKGMAFACTIFMVSLVGEGGGISAAATKVALKMDFPCLKPINGLG